MNELTIPFEDWRPDVALLNNQLVGEAQNVFAGANAYLPMPSTSALSSSTLGTGNDAYVKFLLHCNGTDAATSFPDHAYGVSTAPTWTAAGNAQVDTAQYKFGGASLLCDGTGDWVATPDSADLTFGNGAFTIDVQVRPGAVDGTLINIAGQGNSSADVSVTPWKLQRSAANKIQASISDGFAFTTLTSTTSVVAGSWYHVEFARDGNTIYLFVNGTLEASSAFSATLPFSSSDLRVGACGELTTTPWNGWIDEFRISVGIARHTATFTAPSIAYDTCRGLFMARTSAGAYAVFAGTTFSLEKLVGNNWTDVSRTSGGNYNLAPGDLWSFAQFGDYVYATHANDVLQRIDVAAGSNFAAVGGSPPQASHVATVGDFLVLSGLSTNKKKIQWSAINDPTGWTIGTSLSDEQTTPDGGDVRGIAGDVVALVVQDSCIRAMQFLPGDTDRIFAFAKVESERGAVGKLAFCYTNNTLFFRGSDGFYAWSGGITNIGQDAVNNWFMSNTDVARHDEIVCFPAPNSSRIIWAAYGAATSTDYDRLVIFDYSLNRWTHSTEDAQMWATLVDSNSIKRVGCVDTAGQPALLTGTNQAAIIDTAEHQLFPGRKRAFVTGACPIADTTAAVTVTPYTREDLNDTSTAGTATSLESGTGWASVLASARFHKFRIGIAAGAWTQASGVIVECQEDGEA